MDDRDAITRRLDGDVDAFRVLVDRYLAIVLGVKALSASPPPALIERRGWARAGAILGGLQLTLLAGVIVFNLDRIGRVIEVLRALSDLR
jgi:hypothetical protein